VATTEAPRAADGAESVLDASALLAFIQDERGASVVAEALAATAAISVVNWAEVPASDRRGRRARWALGGAVAEEA
jgi:PIN domain nuclease of toxin-antitoxin system